jgi:hypothetical protein
MLHRQQRNPLNTDRLARRGNVHQFALVSAVCRPGNGAAVALLQHRLDRQVSIGEGGIKALKIVPNIGRAAQGRNLADVAAFIAGGATKASAFICIGDDLNLCVNGELFISLV